MFSYQFRKKMFKYTLFFLLCISISIQAQQYEYSDSYHIPFNDTSPPAKESTVKESNKKEKEMPKPQSFTSNVSLNSDYRFRGISQTMRHPAIQEGFDYSHVNEST